MNYLCDAISNNCLKSINSIILRCIYILNIFIYTANPIGIDGLRLMSERIISLPELSYLDISCIYILYINIDSGFSYTELCFGTNFLRYTPSLKCLKLISIYFYFININR